MYSPSCTTQTAPSPEAWLRIIHKKFGPDYLTKEEERVLLEEGLTALTDILPEGK